jgi:hypothetical protein
MAIWSGRSGLVNTFACFALAVPLALALFWFAQRSTAEPICRSYGSVHGLVFQGVKHYSRDESTTVCQYTQATGETTEVSFQKLAPFLTDLWVSFAIDLKFTVGTITVMLAVLRTFVTFGASAPSADA